MSQKNGHNWAKKGKLQNRISSMILLCVCDVHTQTTKMYILKQAGWLSMNGEVKENLYLILFDNLYFSKPIFEIAVRATVCYKHYLFLQAWLKLIVYKEPIPLFLSYCPQYFVLTFLQPFTSCHIYIYIILLPYEMGEPLNSEIGF